MSYWDGGGGGGGLRQTISLFLSHFEETSLVKCSPSAHEETGSGGSDLRGQPLSLSDLFPFRQVRFVQ